MSRPDVLALVRDALTRVLGVDPATVTRDTTFAELEADSLALVEMVEIVEERLRELAPPGVHIPDEDLDGLRTVGDAVDYAVARL